MSPNPPAVRGVNLDPQTRCAHYHGPTDIIAIKIKCCGVYYACKDCHSALADHTIEVWPETEWDEPAILCGACGTELTIRQDVYKRQPSGWWHWIVYDLPATVDKLPKGAGAEHSSVLPPGTMQGRTDLGNDAYHGPCPDKGDPPHRYTFTVYALSIEKLDVPADSSGAMVVSTAKEHLLGKAVFIAHYGR